MRILNTRDKTIAARGVFYLRVAKPPEPPEHKKNKLSLKNKKTKLTLATLLFLVLVSAGSYYFYPHKAPLPPDPAVVYAKKVKAMTTQVSKYTALPKDEDPTIATVSDKTKLPDENFFKQALDGDKVLMYKKNKEAILFRPSTGQVIAIATLDFRDVTPTPASDVAGASTSASITPNPQGIIAPTIAYHPQGKILVAPQE